MREYKDCLASHAKTFYILFVRKNFAFYSRSDSFYFFLVKMTSAPLRFGKGVVDVVGVVLWRFSFFILTIPSVLKFFLINFQVKFEILLISPQARGLKEGRTEVRRNIVLSVLFFAFVVIGFFYVRADTA